jgi:hypothetical protein
MSAEFESNTSNARLSPRPSSLKSEANKNTDGDSCSSEVSFGEVHVRIFPRELGHHNVPSIGGAPVTIAWNFEKEALYDIDLYESKRLRRQNLHLDNHKRHSLLQEAGYSELDIQKAAAQVHATLQQRASTKMSDNPVEDFLICAGVQGHKMKRAFRRLKTVLPGGKRTPGSCPASQLATR